MRVPYISQRLTSFSDAPLYVNSLDRRSENYLTSDLIQRDGRSIPSIAIDFSMPMHVILHHNMDLFETFVESLLTYSDEITEAMHSHIRLFKDTLRYIN